MFDNYFAPFEKIMELQKANNELLKKLNSNDLEKLSSIHYSIEDKYFGIDLEYTKLLLLNYRLNYLTKSEKN